MSVGQHIKTEKFRKQPDLFSRQRELMKQGVKQFSLTYMVGIDDEGSYGLWEMSYPFRDEDLGPSGPDGGMSPPMEMTAEPLRKAA